MSDARKTGRKYLDFLTEEAEYWQEEGIITQSQSEQILSLYKASTFNLYRVLLIAGAVLLGLGVVSFVASQWHLLPKLLRVCLIAGAYIASVVASCFFMFRSMDDEILPSISASRAAQAFLLLASVIFGAGIFLITRMYDITAMSFASWLGWWSVWVLLTAIVSRDTWQLYLAQIIALLYLNMINAVDIFALQFVNLSHEPISSFFVPANAFALVIALWLAWAVMKERVTLSVNMLITLLLLASRMSMCFGGTWTLVLLALLGAALSFMRNSDIEIFGLLVLGLFGLLLTWREFWHDDMFAPYLSYLPVMTAIFTGVIMLVNIYRGHTLTGIIFFALLASRYFFDNLFGYMPKAWGFSLTGLIFVAAGVFIQRRKKAGSS